MTTPQMPHDSLTQTINRMVDLSIENYYNPYKTFNWPDTIGDDQWWMPPHLLTVYGTRFMDQLGEPQLMALSKWESINFYGLIVYGIRELIQEVTKRIYKPKFEFASDYFHHFIGEENGHMWFFAKYCLKYGLKIYPDRRAKGEADQQEPDVEAFMVFSRILIFEELGDYFNVQIGKDESLHPMIRQLNNVHHQDESRHIAFGRQIVKQLYARLTIKNDPQKMVEHQNFLKRYMNLCAQNLYNPAAYKDAAIAEPYKLRKELLQDPLRRIHHNRFLKRTVDFFVRNDILPQEDFIT